MGSLNVGFKMTGYFVKTLLLICWLRYAAPQPRPFQKILSITHSEPTSKHISKDDQLDRSTKEELPEENPSTGGKRTLSNRIRDPNMILDAGPKNVNGPLKSLIAKLVQKILPGFDGKKTIKVDGEINIKLS